MRLELKDGSWTKPGYKLTFEIHYSEPKQVLKCEGEMFRNLLTMKGTWKFADSDTADGSFVLKSQDVDVSLQGIRSCAASFILLLIRPSAAKATNSC